eukprot:scaffold246150_cov31-Tisochrysis_lutea.AAC.1
MGKMGLSRGTYTLLSAHQVCTRRRNRRRVLHSLSQPRAAEQHVKQEQREEMVRSRGLNWSKDRVDLGLQVK